MEPIQTITVIIFLVTIFLVIVRWIDSVVAALMGVIVMIIAGTMTETEAFAFVDWNVITILVSIWLIAGYFGKTGIPEYLGELSLQVSKGNVPLFVTLKTEQHHETQHTFHSGDSDSTHGVEKK